MKLFGKKTLALILALSMVMSVCVFATEGEGEGGTTPGEGGGESTTPPAVTSVTASLEDSILIVGETTTLEVTVQPEDASQEFTAEVTGDAVTVSGTTVTAAKAGEATITVTAGEKTATCAVKVVENKITAVALKEGEPSEVKIPYGVTFSTSKLNGIKLVATYGEAGDEEITAEWHLKGETALGTAVGASAVYEPVIANKADSLTTLPTVTVKVEQAKIVGPSAALSKGPLPASYTKEQVIAELPTKVTVKLQDNYTDELTIGTELNQWDCSEYVKGTAKTYTFTATIKDTANYTGSNISISVETKAALDVNKVTPSMVAEDYTDTYSDLKSSIKAQIKSQYGVELGSGTTYAFDGEDYGAVGSNGTYTMSLTSGEKTSLRDDGSLKDEFTATVVYDGVTYTVPVELTIYYIVYNTGDDFDYKGGSLSAVATAISGRLNDIYGKGMYEIRFTSISDDGGDLYEDSTCEEYVEEDYSYSLDEMKAMTYLPNGTGEYTEISYTAWTTSDSQEIYGEITLDANAFVLLTGEIGSGDTLDFDADDILDAIYEADDEFEVNYVKFTTLPGSTKGYLYHEYDADKTSNTKVTTSKTYYVDATGTQLELTNYTYVPAKTASGVVEIVFKAYKSSTKSITGVIRVNVIEEADITVAVGKGESIAFDLDWFYDIVKEYATSSKKNYEIAYIVFDNAPGSKSEGYLYVDGDKLTNPDGDKFYAYDSDDGDYDFDDLTFVGGNTAKTTHATFSVYGRKSGTNNNPTSLVTNRTIDFVVGSSHSINNAQSPMKAAQVLNFYNELDAFESLGDNDNVYVEFTSLPKGGKLYYNYGMSTQKDVTVGTEYYITSASGKQLLRNVTFVPSYSSDKIAKTISWGIKGYDKNGKSVTGTVDISVTYAYSSMYFSDISGSLYADSVDFLKNRGITTGVPGGKYDAAGQLSRAELVTFLYRAAGSPAVYGTSKFTDVPTTEYFYKAVLWATQNGITKGTNAAGTLFSPYAKVTNQEIIQFMYNYDVNYLKHTSYVAGSSSFVYDYNKVADWAQVAVKWAVGKSVLTPGLLNPTTVGIRGDIALYLHRMLTLQQ